MPKVGLAAFILAITCMAVANMAGQRMSRLAQEKTGGSYWPPAANRVLARDYREHFGPDRNYVVYGLSHSHFASLAFVVLAVLSVAF
jgi:hypothetical protein